jgi:hypothetical protein
LVTDCPFLVGETVHQRLEERAVVLGHRRGARKVWHQRRYEEWPHPGVCRWYLGWCLRWCLWCLSGGAWPLGEIDP